MSPASPETSVENHPANSPAPRVLDPVSGKMLSNVPIAIRGERVTSVADGLPGPPLPAVVLVCRKENAGVPGAKVRDCI